MGIDVRLCGTEAGYSRHRRARHRPCDPCRTAASAANRRRKLRVAAAGRECPDCGTVTPTTTALDFLPHPMMRVGRYGPWPDGECPGSGQPAPRLVRAS